ncbi:MAG: ABC transporter substrate-binding protein, partial [Chloroflexota bacterium]
MKVMIRKWRGWVTALIALLAMGALAAPARAAELTPATIQMDFILGGKHVPWFVALDKGFYAKRGLNATILAGKGSADTVRSIAAGGADFGFADIATAIVAKSRGTPVQAVAQLGYIATTIVWRDEGVIQGIKDLEGKSWAISPGQAQWFLMPAYCRINKINFKAIKIQETAAPIQPAALATKKADFIVMFRASNDEVADLAASKVGVKLKKIFMKDTGLDIYGSGLIVKDADVK